MAIVISGVNNNDKITATDGTIDLLSGVNYSGILTAPAFTSTGNITAASINVGDSIQVGNAGIITATTLVGNVTGNVNHTSNLLLQISGSEKLRIANSGAFGLNGTNYGSSGQVLTSQGSGSSPIWSTVSGTTINNNAANRIITGSGTANTLEATSNFTYTGNVVTHNNPSGLAKLDVKGSVGGGALGASISVRNTNSANNGSGEFQFQDPGSNIFAKIAGINLTDSSNNGYMTFHTASATSGLVERLRITDAGLIGIATHSPSAAWVDIASDSGSYDHLRMRRLSSDSNVASNWSMKPYGGHLYFREGGSTDKIKFQNDGDLNIMDGNLVLASGHGIDFAATSDSSGTNTSELLDEYEEGTYTPTINVGTFTTFLTHRYIKIGRLVHLHGGLIFHNNSSGTRVEISNIPFAQQTGQQFVGNVWLRRTSTGERNWNMVLGEAGTNIMGIFRDSNGNDMGGHLSYSDFQHSSTYFNYSITYISAT